MNIDQPSAMVLAALIATSPAMLLAVHKIMTPSTAGQEAENIKAETDTAPLNEKMTPSRQRSATRLAPERKALLFLIWGQVSIVIPQVVDGVAPLSNWSFPFVGQGLVMLLIGFWLLLKD